MPFDLITGLPVEHYVPWSFLFATALLATGVDAFTRRPFNPVVLCLWFFGLAFSGAVGAWGVTEIAAGVIILLTPHLLICTFSGRARAVRGAEEADSVSPSTELAPAPHDDVEPPIPLPEPDRGEPSRRVA